MTVKSVLNHGENVRFATGIVITEQLQVFVSLKSVALTAIYVAQEDKRSGYPILMRRIFINNFFSKKPCLRHIVRIIIVLREIKCSLCTVNAAHIRRQFCPTFHSLLPSCSSATPFAKRTSSRLFAPTVDDAKRLSAASSITSA